MLFVDRMVCTIVWVVMLVAVVSSLWVVNGFGVGRVLVVRVNVVLLFIIVCIGDTVWVRLLCVSLVTFVYCVLFRVRLVVIIMSVVVLPRDIVWWAVSLVVWSAWNWCSVAGFMVGIGLLFGSSQRVS